MPIPESLMQSDLIPGVVDVPDDDVSIKEVWNDDLEDAFHEIRAVDTEFPGVVAKPIGEFRSTSDYQYHMLRTNVDLLKIIQVGLTFYDRDGNSPSPISTWQFNFKFKLNEDMYAEDSIQLLQNSGINFKTHEERGISPTYFAELLISSGVVLSNRVRWVSFHSGYDFGYMIKLVTNRPLPSEETAFFELLKLFFPKIYDVKFLMKSCRTLKGGLQEVSEILEVERIGPQHQAGSDSKLTGATFFKMREVFFEGSINENKYCGHLYGLGANFVHNCLPAFDPAITSAAAITEPSSGKSTPISLS